LEHAVGELQEFNMIQGFFESQAKEPLGSKRTMRRARAQKERREPCHYENNPAHGSDCKREEE